MSYKIGDFIERDFPFNGDILPICKIVSITADNRGAMVQAVNGSGHPRFVDGTPKAEYYISLYHWHLHVNHKAAVEHLIDMLRER